MGVAESDLVETAAIPAAGMSGIRRGLARPDPPCVAKMSGSPARVGRIDRSTLESTDFGSSDRRGQRDGWFGRQVHVFDDGRGELSADGRPDTQIAWVKGGMANDQEERAVTLASCSDDGGRILSAG